MRKKLRAVVLVAVAFALAITAAACSNDESSSSPSATVSPSGTEASMIVVTPRPTPVATPSPETTESEEATSSATSSSSSSASGSAGTSGEVLKREMEGEAVTEAQQRLEALGYLDKVTGYFGTDTEKAVKEFQERNDLDVDGKIGPNTLKVLMSEDAKEAN